MLFELFVISVILLLISWLFSWDNLGGLILLAWIGGFSLYGIGYLIALGFKAGWGG